MTPAEKFIAEVRAALSGVRLNGGDSDMETLECIVDALEAYDAAVTEIADDQPEKPQE